ncbi:MAG TPA: hypothetical protein DIS62_03800 [Candidatus Kerfeldbacteria bacterium]|nr:MAG: hypothetical protein UY34_C0002G0014 [Parcubacteria group bacterium GW2011_GWA2_48_9]KKW15784.1 MAG: hypothetical protein UY52_C0014G0027 [Parcubacteria group bacterium GW2011_GWC2_49_9]HCJ52227.1 hypothetical protein [Candidatus Kerfeldbacteria bacterium]HCM68099.1 hypothetical protein [Candidatus Kerfeldbacteria bacterium]
MNDESIIALLVAAGWSEQDVRGVLVGASSNASISSTSRRKWIIPTVILLLLIGAGAVYWFIVRPRAALEDTQVNTNNTNVAAVVPQGTDVIARVFGETVLRSDVEAATRMLLNIDPLSSGIGEFADENTSTEMSVLLRYMGALVDKEVIRRLGAVPKTDEEIVKYIESVMTQEYWNYLFNEAGLRQEDRDIFIHLQIADLRDTELESLVNETLQVSYTDLLRKRVTAEYNAFNRKLAYLSDEEKEYLSLDTHPSRQVSELFFDADANYLINNFETPVPDLDIPVTLKGELMDLQQTPNTLTSLVEENGYFYFGMVYTPDTYDYPEGFDKSDVLIAKFPWTEGLYDSLLSSLTWEDGLTNNEIEIFDTPGLELKLTSSILDEDSDGFYDYLEWVYGSESDAVDTDEDGKTDLQEYEAGTDPTKA